NLECLTDPISFGFQPQRHASGVSRVHCLIESIPVIGNAISSGSEMLWRDEQVFKDPTAHRHSIDGHHGAIVGSLGGSGIPIIMAASLSRQVVPIAVNEDCLALKPACR